MHLGGRYRALASLVAVACLAGVFSACTADQSHRSMKNVTVTARGAQLSLDSVSVTVPRGAAAVGKTLTMQPATSTLPTQAKQVLPALTPMVDVSLGGAQPLESVRISTVLSSTPPDPEALGLLTRNSTTGQWDLLQAQWNASTHTLSASVNHFSLFGFVRIDISPVLSQLKDVFSSTFDLSSAKPSCSGRPLTLNGVTYSLPSRYAGKGDGIVWPCLTKSNNKNHITVDLTNAGGLPYLVRAAPQADVAPQGSVDIGKAAILALYETFMSNEKYSQRLLLPGEKVSYTFPLGGTLPTVALELDSFAQTAMTLVWAVQYVLALLHIDIKILEDADALKCVGDLIGASTSQKFDGRTVGAFAKSTISCFGTVAKQLGGVVSRVAVVVLAALGGGVSIVINDLIAIPRLWTGRDRTQFSLSAPDAISTESGAGSFAKDWSVHGGQMTITSTGNVKITSHSGCADLESTHWCDEVDTGTGTLSADGKVFTVSISTSKVIDENTHKLQSPTPDLYMISGDKFELRFVNPQLLTTKFLRLGGKTSPHSQDIGNPYWCGPKNDNASGVCGA